MKMKSSIIILVLLVLSIVVGCAEKNTKKAGENINKVDEKINKADSSLKINCYLYSTRNEKLIPYCKIMLLSSFPEIESKFISYRDAHEEVNDAKNSIDGNVISATEKMIIISREYEALLAKANVITASSFREGNFTLEGIPNGDYTLYASSEYGPQDFLWIKHIKKGNEGVEITLTNDSTCMIY